MARNKPYQVKDNRIRFKCEECGAKRTLAVPSNVRSRSIKCHRCGTFARCALNRRQYPRQQQTGKVVMILRGGKEITIDLHDISENGVGINTGPGGGRMLRLKEEVQFKCNWNSRLFSSGRYVVKNIHGDRIGIKNVGRRGWA
ncbi:MAG TPA: hypothetical protein VJ969_01485 [Desulfopila sp.]|nr:hypothetical protein [Desulfopila sp.]